MAGRFTRRHVWRQRSGLRGRRGTIQVMREEKLIENSAAMGQVLVAGLRRLQEEHPEIGDVRGRGLMVGTEFTSPQGKPWTERAKAVVKASLANGLLLLTCGSWTIPSAGYRRSW